MATAEKRDVTLKIMCENLAAFAVDREDIKQLLATLPEDEPVVYVVGQQAHGEARVEWSEKHIAVSQYPLSACVALGRICNAHEYQWNIL